MSTWRTLKLWVLSYMVISPPMRYSVLWYASLQRVKNLVIPALSLTTAPGGMIQHLILVRGDSAERGDHTHTKNEAIGLAVELLLLQRSSVRSLGCTAAL